MQIEPELQRAHAQRRLLPTEVRDLVDNPVTSGDLFTCSPEDLPSRLRALLQGVSCLAGNANGELTSLEDDDKRLIVDALLHLAEILQARGVLSVAKIMDEIAGRVEEIEVSAPEEEEAIVNSPAYAKLVGLDREKAEIRRLAPFGISVIIFGPSGVGKTQMARAFHELSPRNNARFQVLDCTNITNTIAEAELFGHTKGAYTGATHARKGLVSLADGGTLFIDEIGELDPTLQSKLLRFLQDGTFRAVGSEEDERADVRVIAATHRDLEKLVATGRFREDLYYRLLESSFKVRSLSERRNEVPLLAQRLLERHRISPKFPGRKYVKGFSPEAIGKLVSHSWPGNVRELENTVKHALTYDIATDGLIQESHIRLLGQENGSRVQIPDVMVRGTDAILIELLSLAIRVSEGDAAAKPLFSSIASASTTPLKDLVGQFEGLLLQAGVAVTDTNVALGELLATNRTTIVQKLKVFGISRNKNDL